MNKWLEKISILIGFTKNEIQIILFLLSTFFVGLIVLFIKEKLNNPKALDFNYKEHDSLFLASLAEDSSYLPFVSSANDKYHNFKRSQNTGEKASEIKKKKIAAPGKIISLNNASLDDFISLPGIGFKIAGNIISYRRLHNGFKNIEELINVKGIGNAKLNKIRNMLSL